MEFELIERIRRRVHARDDVLLGIGDDAAIVRVPDGRELVIAMDTLNAGVHFPHATAPRDIGWKALAVNLSDLAAVGAQPAWCTLSLSMPHADAAWLDAFVDGFAELAALHRVSLIGGDTTRGPLSICVTVHGFSAAGRVLRRDAARPGDDIWVSGTLGDAALALPAVLAGDAVDAALRVRLDRPTPRIDLGLALAAVAHACIDVSDGLLADAAHVAHASGVRIAIDVDALPASAAAMTADAAARRIAQATGGDDYELLFTAPPEAADVLRSLAITAGVALTCIGRVDIGTGVVTHDRHGNAWSPPTRGHVHFA